MDNSKIYIDYNPWWEGKTIPSKYIFNTKRRLFGIIKKNIEKSNIISLVGPRRVGKTVLLYQLIESFLKQNIDPKNIFYLSCDDPSIIVEKHIVEDSLDFYEKNIIQNSIKNMRKTIYFFLDEIQKSERWAEYLKKYVDLGYPVKFVVSGSSSIKMIKNSRESLVGRSKEYVLPPLSFSEFINWEEEKLEAFEFNPLNFDQLRSLYKKLFVNKRKYFLVFNRFIRKGGFPETYSMSWRERSDYLKKDVVERVIFRDIPETTKIKNPNLTARLLTFSCYETANILSFQNLSQKLAARFETVSEHLFYLEYSFLISLLRKFSRGGLAVAKSQPKVHGIDPSLILALANKDEVIFTERDFLGRLVESTVVSHLRFSLGFDRLFFWRDERSEVDIIVNLAKSVLPIEVKYTNIFKKSDFSGLSRFQAKYKNKKAFVLTDDFFGREEEKIFLPVWFFLAGDIVV